MAPPPMQQKAPTAPPEGFEIIAEERSSAVVIGEQVELVGETGM